MTGDVNLGTSSWQFDAWRGVFYPEQLPRTRFLSFYATQFNTVEVNTSFYALPAPSTLIGWIDNVPDGFTFALKFPRAISHEKRLVGCETETLAFLDALRALGEAAAPAFLQLPPDFSRHTSGRTLVAYVDWLAAQAADLQLAVEVRARDLMTPAFAAFLAERNMALVLVDRWGTPDLYLHWLAQVEAGKGPRFGFVRWIGDVKDGPTGDREVQIRRDDDLARWAGRCVALAKHGMDVYGYMHNPYEGHSPASVRRLQARLAPQLVLPAWPPRGTIPAEQLSLL